MIGQQLMRSRIGSRVMGYSNLMPFGSTRVILDKWHPKNKVNVNANYIKTSFCENHPTNDYDPFGLMIATNGPIPRSMD